MKTSFQVCNIANPNSFKNSVMFSIFEAPDIYTNIKIALKPFIEQINQLHGFLAEDGVLVYKILENTLKIFHVDLQAYILWWDVHWEPYT